MNYQTRRQLVADQLKSQALMIIFAGEEVIKNADEYYPFDINHNFYYLTGIEQRNSIYVVRKTTNETVHELYVLPHDPIQAKWVGDTLKIDEVKKISGIDNVYTLDVFERNIFGYTLNFGLNNVYLDMEHLRSHIYKGQPFENYVGLHLPQLRIRDVFLVIAKLRAIKSQDEVEMIVKALKQTDNGLKQVMKNIKPGKYEYELENTFDYTNRQAGFVHSAFKTIAAGGARATVLHYHDNNQPLKGNELILMDLGLKYGHYSCDISRTYPVSGKFDKKQRAVYQLVLNAQKLVLNAIKPGVTINQLNQIVIDYYCVGLKKWGLIQEDHEVSRYYYHGVGHSLGLDTHDVGFTRGMPLVAGNVITVEPGLYIEEWGVGVRIEDDVLVTETGMLNLSQHIIKEIDEIEAFMNV
jgi:Xaa-Pro aminopeptidase